MRVIAGDIGGTKTIIALAEADGPRVEVIADKRYDSKAHATLTEIVQDFAREHDLTGLRACFGIAGPTDGVTAKTTNLPWLIDARALERDTGLASVRLINDFAAAASGIECVRDADVVTLHEGESVEHAPRAVMGAGTGLGQALLYWSGTHYEVQASEGGHCDFAPRNELEVGLWRFIAARHGHVSWERVVSGMGIQNIYEYLRTSGTLPESEAVRAEMQSTDRNAVIGRHALAGDDALCVKTIEMFASAYGAQAGNLAMAAIARGGVFLAGGIAAKVLPCLRAGAFAAAYTDKGRLKGLVEKIPVRVVTEPKLGLLGAAATAARG